MLHDWAELGAGVWWWPQYVCLIKSKSSLNKLKLAAAVNRHHRSCENICIANLSMFSSFACADEDFLQVRSQKV